MIDRRAVTRYAEALFDLAEKKNVLADIDGELEKAASLLLSYPEVSHLVLNSTIALTEKEDFLGKILPAGTSKLVLNFLKVLIKKKRFRELAAIQETFRELYENKMGIQEVEVVTAVSLSDQNGELLKKVLKKKLNREIRLITKVKPEILGGMILRFEGNELNASYRAELDSMKQQLMAG